MANKFRLRWTARAKADLRSIKAYIAQHAPRTADSVVRSIRDRCRRLLTMPLAAPMVEEFGRETIRETYYGNYRIIYVVGEGTMTVIAAFHGARLLTDEILRADED
jgi:toxin ParE1/3/4